MKSVDSEQNRDVEKCMNKEIENIFLFCLFQGWESSQHITNDRIPWIKSETNKQKIIICRHKVSAEEVKPTRVWKTRYLKFFWFVWKVLWGCGMSFYRESSSLSARFWTFWTLHVAMKNCIPGLSQMYLNENREYNFWWVGYFLLVWHVAVLKSQQGHQNIPVACS